MNLADTAILLLPIAAVFLLAGFVKGVVGLGLPTISMGLLSLVMAPAQAASTASITCGWWSSKGRNASTHCSSSMWRWRICASTGTKAREMSLRRLTSRL